MLLTATTHSARVITSTDADVHYQASYVTLPDGGAAPVWGSSQGAIASATTTTVVAAPGSNEEISLAWLSLVNTHASKRCTVTLLKTVSGTDYRVAGSVTLGPGESMHYADGQIVVMTARGEVKAAGIAPHPIGTTVMQSPIYSTANITSNRTITSTNTFALYMGPAPRALPGCLIRQNVTTALATTTWAEVALAKGAPNFGGNPTLTPVGYADVSASHNSTGLKATMVSVSAGQSIDEGDDVWALFGCQATTAMVLRAQSIADDLACGFSAVATMRPSTAIGTPTAFTADSATDLPIWAALQV